LVICKINNINNIPLHKEYFKQKIILRIAWHSTVILKVGAHNKLDWFWVSEWVSEWLLFNANSAIVQLYHGKNKVIFNEMMMDWFCRSFKFCWNFYIIDRMFMGTIF
jgi:hypothetical protein